MWEDEDDGTEEPLEGKEIAAASAPVMPEKVSRMVFETTSWDESRLAEMVLSRVAEKVEKRLTKAINGQIREAVEAAVAGVVQERVTAQVDAVMAEGWRKTDNYGTPIGQALTLKDRVSEILNSRRDSYGNGLTYVQEAITNQVNNVLNKELATEIEAAKKKVRETLDSKVMEKLQVALKEGLGLKA